MIKLLLLIIGGACGTLLRYFFSDVVYNFFPESFPWGTLSVNLIGALIAGLFFGVIESVMVPPYFRVFFIVGFLGAFTTLSAYSLETFNLLRDGELKLAFFNMLATTFLSVALVFIGFVFARFLWGYFK